MRNLTKTLAVVSILAPSSGYSLGIGDIKLHSALNQNLEAEISLVVSSDEKASDIRVNIAPPDKFDEAGVPWTSILSKIKFTTLVGTNGSVNIKLTTQEAVKEPLLDFLLEVSWPRGNLYREFTVLLDPPAVYKQPTLPVLTSNEGFEPEAAAHSQQPKNFNNISSFESGQNTSNEEYGPTRKNDSLWKIADRASKQQGVSVEQMMIAIYEENPTAFYRENIHALLAGKTLKIPKKELVLKLSRKQALADFNRQTNIWKKRQDANYIEPADSKPDSPNNQLTLVAPAETDISEKAIITHENQQISDKNKDHEILDKETSNINSPLNDVLQSKVVELEKQLAVMQQILALKDQQLATLQNQSKPSLVVSPGSLEETTSKNDKLGIKEIPSHSELKSTVNDKPEKIWSISSNYLWFNVMGLGALSLFGWLWWRKRQLAVQTDSQSKFAPSSMSENLISDDVIFQSKDFGNNREILGKDTLLNELKFDDIDLFDADQSEIDPISEADVYLAYGRYQQAENLIRDAIRDQPDCDDFKLKLLEIYYSNKNAHAFEIYASEIAKEGKKDNVEFWKKVSRMGNDICREAKLFSLGLEEFCAKENTNIESKNILINQSYDLENIKFTDKKINNMSASSFDDAINNDAGIDFGLNSFLAKDSSESKDAFEFPDQDPDDSTEFASFDIDFDTTIIEENGIDVIDRVIIKESDNNYEPTENLTDLSSVIEPNIAKNSFDISFDSDMSIAELDNKDFDHISMDNYEIKLDLAKASIDMIDTKSAQDNGLVEVLQTVRLSKKRK